MPHFWKGPTKPVRGWELIYLLAYAGVLLTGMAIVETLRPKWVLPALLGLALIHAIALGLNKLWQRRIARRIQELRQEFSN